MDKNDKRPETSRQYENRAARPQDTIFDIPLVFSVFSSVDFFLKFRTIGLGTEHERIYIFVGALACGWH